jgi:hypothetical protein
LIRRNNRVLSVISAIVEVLLYIIGLSTFEYYKEGNNKEAKCKEEMEINTESEFCFLVTHIIDPTPKKLASRVKT